MPERQGSRRGYLVLADISGYTAFLAGTELEHAQAIIYELTTLLRERLAPPMRFVKLEGDAVFCYADSAAFGDGERLAELLEACYFDFSNRLRDMGRATTCRCTACATMGSLDLKFVAHFGAFVVQRSAGIDDLAGPDVILAHRLLKNSITKRLGCRAYVFFTAACLKRLPSTFILPEHRETYESLGETNGGVHDLEPVLRQMREDRREYISSADADIEMTFDLPVSSAVAWRYLVDPVERLRWACRGSTPDRIETNARGRMGAGATQHCSHGGRDALHEFIDWRPFSYATCRTMTPLAGVLVLRRAVVETTEFVPRDGGGTLVQHRIRLADRSPLSKLMFQPAVLFYREAARRWLANLLRAIEEDRVVLDSVAHALAMP